MRSPDHLHIVLFLAFPQVVPSETIKKTIHKSDIHIETERSNATDLYFVYDIETGLDVKASPIAPG